VADVLEGDGQALTPLGKVRIEILTTVLESQIAGAVYIR
jgi:hypothetical protein